MRKKTIEMALPPVTWGAAMVFGGVLLAGGVTPVCHGAAVDVLLPGSAETFHPPKTYDIPLGHPDFYPSDERPIGWRGDRTGAFPGATGPNGWDAETGDGIAWKVDTVGPGFSQPIVVGEKVFVTCDPNWLVCYNVHNGKELWRTAIDHTLAMDKETSAKARKEIEYFDKLKVLRGRWSSECEDLNLLIAKAGGDMKSIWKQEPKQRTLLKPEGAAVAKLLENAEIKSMWERLYAEQQEYALSYTSDDHGKVWTPEIAKRIEEANLLYDIWFDGRWLGYCTYSWPTPCSDGEFIYVTTANNAAAAVSVADGSIKWIIWDHMGDANGKRPTAFDETGIGTRYALSPVLYKDFLVVNQDSHVRAYNKRTGKKVWEIWNPYGARKALIQEKEKRVLDAWNQAWSTTSNNGLSEKTHVELAALDWNKICDERWKAQKGAFFKAGARAVPEANSPCVVEVPLDGGGVMPVVYDGSLFLYRLEDGKVLRSDMPMGHNSSVVAAGNAVMKNVNNTFLLHLTAKDKDTVRTHCVHFINGSGTKTAAVYAGNKSGIWSSGDTTVYHDGLWYNAAKCGGEKDASNATVAMSVRDGSYKTYAMLRASGGDPSFILVGRRLYDFQGVDLYGGKNKQAYNFRHDVNGVGEAGYVDLDANNYVNIKNGLVDRRIERDADYAYRHAYERPGTHGCSSSPYAQANRIFMRTKGILYCIGDPKQPFPVPKNCPAQGRVSN